MSETNAKPTHCDQFRDDLKAYSDGELPMLRRAAVRRHLFRCVACRAELSETERITQLMKTTANATPATLTPNFRARLISALEGTPADAPPAVPLWRRRPALVFAGGGTLATASLVAFFVLYRSAEPMYAPSSVSVGAANLMYAQDYDGSQVAATSETRTEMSAAEAPNIPLRSVPASAAPRAPGAISRDTGRPLLDNPRGGDVTAATDPLADTFIAKSAAKGQSRTVETRRRNPSLEVAGAVMIDRQVHREASIGVAVDKLEATSDAIEEKVKSLGGYVASNDLITDASGYKSAELIVKVPEKDFENTLKDFAKMGEVVSKSVAGEDITEKLSDATSDEQVLVDEVQKLDARLKSENMSERRTGQKEAELREAKMQLARTRARLGLLRNMAALSTINVSLTQKAKKAAAAPPQPGWLQDLRETNKAAGLAFQSAVRVPIVLCVWVLAFSPLWIPLLLAYRWAAIKTAAKNALPTPEAR